jgi:hypothetical protein
MLEDLTTDDKKIANDLNGFIDLMKQWGAGHD